VQESEWVEDQNLARIKLPKSEKGKLEASQQDSSLDLRCFAKYNFAGQIAQGVLSNSQKLAYVYFGEATNSSMVISLHFHYHLTPQV
jgi:hypothetical protein